MLEFYIQVIYSIVIAHEKCLKKLNVLDSSLLWQLMQSFSHFPLFSLGPLSAHTQPCDVFIKEVSRSFPDSEEVTFSTDITEEGAAWCSRRRRSIICYNWREEYHSLSIITISRWCSSTAHDSFYDNPAAMWWTRCAAVHLRSLLLSWVWRVWLKNLHDMHLI